MCLSWFFDVNGLCFVGLSLWYTCFVVYVFLCTCFKLLLLLIFVELLHTLINFIELLHYLNNFRWISLTCYIHCSNENNTRRIMSNSWQKQSIKATDETKNQKTQNKIVVTETLINNIWPITSWFIGYESTPKCW